jgi:Winged helix DNA-binding domain
VGAALQRLRGRQARLRALLAGAVSLDRQGPRAGRGDGRAAEGASQRRAHDGPRGRARARHQSERPEVRGADGHGRHPLGRRAGIEIWTVEAPEIDPAEARRELARRYLHIFGPGTAEGFGGWAGIKPPAAAEAFAALEGSLLAVRSPIGDAWLLADDEPAMRAEEIADAPARLLPSGDAYFLLAGTERELLVPREEQRSQLWTPRVWPGAVLVDGEIRGTWRRAQHTVRIDTWEPLSRASRDAVEAEAGALPLPGIDRPIEVVWNT